MNADANDYAALALIFGFMAGWLLAWSQRTLTTYTYSYESSSDSVAQNLYNSSIDQSVPTQQDSPSNNVRKASMPVVTPMTFEQVRSILKSAAVLT